MREHLHSNNNNYLEGQDDQGDHDTQSPPMITLTRGVDPAPRKEGVRMTASAVLSLAARQV